jgi:hypothetical protein
MRWAFLLRHDSALDADYLSRFYDFLPCPHGPFSFVLQHEIDVLARKGIMTVPDKTRLDVSSHMRTAFLSANDPLAVSVKKFVAARINASPDSSRRPLGDKRIAPPEATPHATSRKAYTAGYEGASVDFFVGGLLRRGIRRVIDVRNNPVSRRYGFHKGTLSRICENVGLLYEHIPALGIPSAWRSELSAQSDYDALFDRYDSDIVSGKTELLDGLANRIKHETSVLICLEADPRRCHRTRLARTLGKRADLEFTNIVTATA